MGLSRAEPRDIMMRKRRCQSNKLFAFLCGDLLFGYMDIHTLLSTYRNVRTMD